MSEECDQFCYELNQMRSERDALRQKMALHPFGECTCCGEGQCGWCRRSDALHSVETYRKALERIASENCSADPWGDGTKRRCPDQGWEHWNSPVHWCSACYARGVLEGVIDLEDEEMMP